MPKPMPQSLPIIEYEILQVLNRLAQEKRDDGAPSVVNLFEEEPLKSWLEEEPFKDWHQHILTHVLAKTRLPPHWRHDLPQLGRVVFIP
ncbi:hypothetical protein [Phyllobacterium phragmitis]|uniref:Uncharacterized protein n=1 Tax=Phyllobacterium phragmitis TaxID=2670329 RepID=A0ABQ0GZ08_9HYPH